jgi:hypothetical protein
VPSSLQYRCQRPGYRVRPPDVLRIAVRTAFRSAARRCQRRSPGRADGRSTWFAFRRGPSTTARCKSLPISDRLSTDFGGGTATAVVLAQTSRVYCVIVNTGADTVANACFNGQKPCGRRSRRSTD